MGTGGAVFASIANYTITGIETVDRIYFASGSASGVPVHSNAGTLPGLLNVLNAAPGGTLVYGNVGNQTYVVESLHTSGTYFTVDS